MEGLRNTVSDLLTSLIKFLLCIRTLFDAPIHFLCIDLGSKLLSK